MTDINKLEMLIGDQEPRGGFVAIPASEAAAIISKYRRMEEALREAAPYVPDHHGPVQHLIRQALQDEDQ